MGTGGAALPLDGQLSKWQLSKWQLRQRLPRLGALVNDVSRSLTGLTLTLLALAGCGSDAGTGPADGFGRADLPALFATPTSDEKQAVLADWASRDLSAAQVRIELRDTVAVGIDTVEVRILSHLVQGERHYGALVLPVDATPRPVVVYAHYSDIGVGVESTLFATGAVAGIRASEYALLLPSYRGKQIAYGGQAWVSEGSVSLWDGEVDDLLGLLQVAWEQPGVQPDAAVTLGFSAGGLISLLAAIREPRIDGVVDFFGPTDFFGLWAQGLLVDVLDGVGPDLASIPELERSLVDPLDRGELSLAEMRLHLLRRSPLHFVERLPPVLAHHGTADDVVDVEQTRSLEAAMQRSGGSVSAWYYDGGGHSPFDLSGSLARTAAFLRSALATGL